MGSSCTISSLARTQSKARGGCAQRQVAERMTASRSMKGSLMPPSIQANEGSEQNKTLKICYISTDCRSDVCPAGDTQPSQNFGGGGGRVVPCRLTKSSSDAADNRSCSLF